MSKISEKICVSPMPPEDGSLVWIDVSSTPALIKVFNSGEWQMAGGAGSGGDCNLHIGTKEQRLALTPKNGMEFNQVEEDGVVHHYTYDQNEWVLLASPEVHDAEEVILMIDSNDGELSLDELEVTVENLTTGVTHTVDIDETGEGIIHIPLEEEYKIIFPKPTSYKEVAAMTLTAERYQRTIPIHYIRVYDDIRDVARGYVLEASSDPDITLNGNENAIEDILDHAFSFVLDEQHKAYAKLSRTDHTKFADGTNWTGVYGNAFKHFGKIYLFKDSSYGGNGSRYYVSENPISNLCLTEHIGEFNIGLFKAGYVNNALVSRPNLVPKATTTISDFQQYALNNGADYGITDYQIYKALRHLYAAKYGNVNSDRISSGLRDAGSNYYGAVTGATISLGDASGEATYQSTAYKQCKLFGIEALWGQMWEFAKGIRFDQGSAIIYEGNVVSDSKAGLRSFARNTNLSSSYITSMALGENGDMIPTAGNGSSGTYYCDGSWSAVSGRILGVGGLSDYGTLAGLFGSASSDVFSFSHADSGARLSFYGNLSEYEEVDGATLAAMQ